MGRAASCATWGVGQDVVSDEDLVQRCREGDDSAWEDLVRRHQDRILNLAYQFVGETEEARDLAQEVFVRVYQRLELYDPERVFRTWLNSLARNLCIDRYRHRRQERRCVTTPVEEMTTLVSPALNPAQHLDRERRRQLVLHALDMLSAISREAIVLKDLQELTLEEMAEQMELPLGTVKSRVFRARLELGRAILKLEEVHTGGGVGVS